jgi:cyclophilin family peptidyl-prolyl cis-trans isomerase
MNVRISRQDGTFYVRDDLPDTPENRVFYGSLQLGLFGTVAPTCVEQFLSYISVPVVDDDPLPSYARSNFVSLNQATGLLTGGSIPSLQATQLSGSTALQYGGRILSAPLWVESNPQRVSHSGKGLLTHRNLEVLPTFGITTRADSRELDNSYTVFGQVLFDDSSREFLNLVESLPTYSVERPKGATETTVDNVAAAVYNSQREFFRSAAKTFGDTRLDKVYPGKLLRRVEVTQVELVR